MTALHLAPNLPMPSLPDDLAARFDLHEGHRFHAICGACSVAVGWTKDELKSGAWLGILRAHRCAS